MLSDPAAAAWVAAGRPAVDAPAPVDGRCGRCGEDGPTVTSARIISEKFTGFDAWPFGSRRLCTPCAWAYSRPPSAVPAMLITTNTVTEHPKGVGLASILTAGALPNTHAVVLPASRHRHILATAEWGHLATDGLVTVWDFAAASRLSDLIMVRRAVTAWVRANAADKKMNGRQITSEINRALLCDMPPYPLLAAQPRDSWPRFLAAWTALQPWRTVTPLWAATKILATTT
ncbi:hypothetical protein KL953_35135 [Mycolicibacterium goodii]|uniref:hypothetical protein n=1 Tax=Mycolicibacterium goodii TaxID=134601 RepID=UPI001BDC566E|nr:hypothetical protein [Mycolicibacterium goodii]MBU8814096.1 hypothetical protein [Mycolicibacterium goodii]